MILQKLVIDPHSEDDSYVPGRFVHVIKTDFESKQPHVITTHTGQHFDNFDNV